MTGLLVTVFVASFLGSLHCLGMCGPFALMAGSHARTPGQAILPTALYSGGRLMTYATLGGLAGWAGMAFNLGTEWTRWQQGATYLAGGVMILVGLVALLRQFGWSMGRGWGARYWSRALGPAQRWVAARSGPAKAFLMGTLTTLMPCGWLYTFVLAAAGTAHPAWGTLLMVVFWAGTVPVMAGLMLGTGLVSVSLQRHIPWVTAVLVIGIGVFTVFVRAPVRLDAATVATNDPAQVQTSIERLDHETLPCCQD